MDASEIATLIVAIAGAVGGLLSWFKMKPGEKKEVESTMAQSTLNIAKGTIDLVTEELEQQFKRMTEEQKIQRELHQAEIAHEREQVAQLRAELDMAREEVRLLRKELQLAKNEVDEWKNKHHLLEIELGKN